MKTKQGLYWLAAFIPAPVMFIMSNWALCDIAYDGFILGKMHMSIPSAWRLKPFSPCLAR